MLSVVTGPFFFKALKPNSGRPFESVGPTPYDEVTQSVSVLDSRVELAFCVLLVADVFFTIFTTFSVGFVGLLFLFKFSMIPRGDVEALSLVTLVVLVCVTSRGFSPVECFVVVVVVVMTF